jgi:pimeloyl-ACP methyl ester carboxylesterase
MAQARLHDGSTIEVQVHGQGPALLLPVNPRPVEGPRAEELRRWGNDPALGRSLIDGLTDAFRVVAFDYEGHVLQVPKPATLTPDNLAMDFLAVADAVGAERFAWYGYSWLAVAGLQLALRTDRVAALVMGGWPPIDGPYAEMLRVTGAAHDMASAPSSARQGPVGDATPAEPASGAAPPSSPEELDWSTVEVPLSEAQTRQFDTLYQALRSFDDRAAQARLSCPRLCFAGSADDIDYPERWGGVRVHTAGPLLERRAELEAYGWEVRVLDGLDHTQAMQAAAVLPILRPFLTTALATSAP